MFELFGCVKDEIEANTSGIGLGLVVSRLIVEALGGQISFKSREGTGSVFTFTMQFEELVNFRPIERRLSQIQSRPNDVVLKSGSFSNRVLELQKMEASNQKRILVVDDEEFCLEATRQMLIKAGIDVENLVDFCIDGEEMVRTVKAAAGYQISYKLILTDFSMPKLNGIEATQDVRKYFNEELKKPIQDQPVIIGVTGHSEQSFKQRGLDVGMNKI